MDDNATLQSNDFPANIEDIMHSAYLQYSLSVNVGRAIPDVRDGMKPGNRRILYAMRQLGIPPNAALLQAETVPTAVVKPTPVPPQVDPELRWDARSRLLTPNLAGLSMRDALVTLQGAGLEIHLEGTGRVVQQSPTPGRPIRPGQPVEPVTP